MPADGTTFPATALVLEARDYRGVFIDTTTQAGRAHMMTALLRARIERGMYFPRQRVAGALEIHRKTQARERSNGLPGYFANSAESRDWVRKCVASAKAEKAALICGRVA